MLKQIIIIHISQILIKILKLFNKQMIIFPFPQLDVHLNNKNK